MPRCLSSTSALTRFTSSSSALCSKPRGEDGRENLGLLLRHFAAIKQSAFLQSARVESRQQHAQAVRDVQKAAERCDCLRIERRNVHCMANRPGREIRGEQLNGFDGDLRLCFFGARAQVRRANDARQSE